MESYSIVTTAHIMADGSEFVDRGQPEDPVSQTFTQKSVVEAATLEQQRLLEDEALKRQGNFAWEKLHSYRGCDPQWLELWVYFIPNRCECKNGYQKLIEELPPDFSTPESFFSWGVSLHNAVNEKLGKPCLSLEDARSMWKRMN